MQMHVDPTTKEKEKQEETFGDDEEDFEFITESDYSAKWYCHLHGAWQPYSDRDCNILEEEYFRGPDFSTDEMDFILGGNEDRQPLEGEKTSKNREDHHQKNAMEEEQEEGKGQLAKTEVEEEEQHILSPLMMGGSAAARLSNDKKSLITYVFDFRLLRQINLRNHHAHPIRREGMAITPHWMHSSSSMKIHMAFDFGSCYPQWSCPQCCHYFEYPLSVEACQSCGMKNPCSAARKLIAQGRGNGNAALQLMEKVVKQQLATKGFFAKAFDSIKRKFNKESSAETNVEGSGEGDITALVFFAVLVLNFKKDENISSAKAMLSRCDSLFSSNPKTEILRGLIYVREGEMEVALRCFEELEKRRVKGLRFMSNDSLITSRCLDVLSAGISADAKQKAEVAFKNEKFEECISCYRKALSMNTKPDSSDQVVIATAIGKATVALDLQQQRNNTRESMAASRGEKSSSVMNSADDTSLMRNMSLALQDFTLTSENTNNNFSFTRAESIQLQSEVAEHFKIMLESRQRKLLRNFCFDVNPENSSEVHLVKGLSGIWQSRLFTGLFGDPYINNTELEGGYASPSLFGLCGLFTVISQILEQQGNASPWFSDEQLFPPKMHSNFAENLRKVSDLLNVASQRSLEDLASIPVIFRDLQKLPKGEMYVLAGGWRGEDSGHCIVYVFVHRQEENSSNLFDFIVCNSGDGVGNHYPCGEAFPKVKYQVCLPLLGIPEHRIVNKAFLHALSHIYRNQDKRHCPKLFYHHILPALIGKPFAVEKYAPPPSSLTAGGKSFHTNITTVATRGSEELSTFRSVQKSGTCYIKSVVAGTRYLLSSHGFSTIQIKVLLTFVRYLMLQTAQLELSLHQSYSLRQSGGGLWFSDYMMIGIACKQLVFKCLKGYGALASHPKLLLDASTTTPQPLSSVEDKVVALFQQGVISTETAASPSSSVTQKNAATKQSCWFSWSVVEQVESLLGRIEAACPLILIDAPQVTQCLIEPYQPKKMSQLKISPLDEGKTATGVRGNTKPAAPTMGNINCDIPPQFLHFGFDLIVQNALRNNFPLGKSGGLKVHVVGFQTEQPIMDRISFPIQYLGEVKTALKHYIEMGRELIVARGICCSIIEHVILRQIGIPQPLFTPTTTSTSSGKSSTSTSSSPQLMMQYNNEFWKSATSCRDFQVLTKAMLELQSLCLVYLGLSAGEPSTSSAGCIAQRVITMTAILAIADRLCRCDANPVAKLHREAAFNPFQWSVFTDMESAMFVHRPELVYHRHALLSYFSSLSPGGAVGAARFPILKFCERKSERNLPGYSYVRIFDEDPDIYFLKDCHAAAATFFSASTSLSKEVLRKEFCHQVKTYLSSPFQPIDLWANFRDIAIYCRLAPYAGPTVGCKLDSILAVQNNTGFVEAGSKKDSNSFVFCLCHPGQFTAEDDGAWEKQAKSHSVIQKLLPTSTGACEEAVMTSSIKSWGSPFSPEDVEYLTSAACHPYLRIPLTLDRLAKLVSFRISSPTLEKILGGFLYEVGEWGSKKTVDEDEEDVNSEDISQIPNVNANIVTKYGLLQNEIMKNSASILSACTKIIQVVLREELAANKHAVCPESLLLAARLFQPILTFASAAKQQCAMGRSDEAMRDEEEGVFHSFAQIVSGKTNSLLAAVEGRISAMRSTGKAWSWQLTPLASPGERSARANARRDKHRQDSNDNSCKKEDSAIINLSFNDQLCILLAHRSLLTATALHLSPISRFVATISALTMMNTVGMDEDLAIRLRHETNLTFDFISYGNSVDVQVRKCSPVERNAVLNQIVANVMGRDLQNVAGGAWKPLPQGYGVYQNDMWKLCLRRGLLCGPTGVSAKPLSNEVVRHPDFIRVFGKLQEGMSPLAIVTEETNEYTSYQTVIKNAPVKLALWKMLAPSQTVITNGSFLKWIPSANTIQIGNTVFSVLLGSKTTTSKTSFPPALQEFVEDATAEIGLEKTEIKWFLPATNDVFSQFLIQEYALYRLATVVSSVDSFYIFEMWISRSQAATNPIAWLFLLCEHGRRVFRKLCWTSNYRFTLASDGMTPMAIEAPSPIAGLFRDASGSVTRKKEQFSSSSMRISLITPDTIYEHIPGEALCGALPESLSADVTLWLVAKVADIQQKKLPSMFEVIALSNGNLPAGSSTVTSSSVGEGGSTTSAVGRRMKNGNSNSRFFSISIIPQGLAHIRTSDDRVLRNPLYPSDAFVCRAVSTLTRLDTLSHVLIWNTPEGGNKAACSPKGIITSPTCCSSSSADFGPPRFEMPRVALKFGIKPYTTMDGIIEYRIASLSHPGLYISNERDERHWELLSGMPHAVLMESEALNMYVLLPSAEVTRPVVKSCPFSVSVIVNYESIQQIQGDSPRTYCIGIHSSREFLQPETLEAALYVVNLYLMRRQYSSANTLLERCQSAYPLLPSEARVLSMFEPPISSTSGDAHPDSLAVHLRLSLALDFCTETTWWGESFPVNFRWSLPDLFDRYKQCQRHVSAECRLTPQEQLQLLQLRYRETSREELKRGSSSIDSYCSLLDNSPENMSYLEYLHAVVDLQKGVGGERNLSPTTIHRSSKEEGCLGVARQEKLVSTQIRQTKSLIDCIGQQMRKNKPHDYYYNVASFAYFQYPTSLTEDVSLPALISASSEDMWNGASHGLGFCFLYDLISGHIRVPGDTFRPEDEPVSFLTAFLVSMAEMSIEQHSGGSGGQSESEHFALLRFFSVLPRKKRSLLPPFQKSLMNEFLSSKKEANAYPVNKQYAPLTLWYHSLVQYLTPVLMEVGATAAKQPKPSQAPPLPSSATTTNHPLRPWLTKFFEEKNSTILGHVDILLAAFHGNEDALVAKLEKDYNAPGFFQGAVLRPSTVLYGSNSGMATSTPAATSEFLLIDHHVPTIRTCTLSYFPFLDSHLYYRPFASDLSCRLRTVANIKSGSAQQYVPFTNDDILEFSSAPLQRMFPFVERMMKALKNEEEEEGATNVRLSVSNDQKEKEEEGQKNHAEENEKTKMGGVFQSETIKQSPVYLRSHPIAQGYLAQLIEASEFQQEGKERQKGEEFDKKNEMICTAVAPLLAIQTVNQLPQLRVQLNALRQKLLQFRRSDIYAASSAHLWCTELCGFAKAAPVISNFSAVEEVPKSEKETRIFTMLHAIEQTSNVPLVALSRLSLSSHAVKDIQQVNPFLKASDGKKAVSIALIAMLRYSRVMQAGECIGKICDTLHVLDALEDTRVETMYPSSPHAPRQRFEKHRMEINASLGAIAKAFNSRRWYMERCSPSTVEDDRKNVEEDDEDDDEVVDHQPLTTAVSGQQLQMQNIQQDSHHHHRRTTTTHLDPSFLCFEFHFGCMLWKRQIEMINRLSSMANQSSPEGHSAIFQMLMGQGKSSVVSPLLALRLCEAPGIPLKPLEQMVPQISSISNPKLREEVRAIATKEWQLRSPAAENKEENDKRRENAGEGEGTSVVDDRPAHLLLVPQSLIRQTLTVFGRRYTRMTGRPVLLFSCRRVMKHMEAMELQRKVDVCAENKSILVASPESIKTMLLKAAEHSCQYERGVSTTTSTPSLGRVAQANLMRRFPGVQPSFSSTTRSVAGGKSFNSQEAETELEALLNVLVRFSKGQMIVDEVDTIMNPLRSELNFPLGEEMPISMKELRWEFPMKFLHEAFFVLKQGVASQNVQTCPHLNLVSKKWYREYCAPLLVEISVQKVLMQKPFEIQFQNSLSFTDEEKTEKELIVFMKDAVQGWRSGLHSPQDLTSILPREIDRQCVVLAVLWIATLAPHVLSKVHLVNFGILVTASAAASSKNISNVGGGNRNEDNDSDDQEDNENEGGEKVNKDGLLSGLEAEDDPRSQLAIPYLAKDVPAEGSQFAHPDVAIGLTFLALRHGGLQMTHCKAVLRYIYVNFISESGMEQERPSYLLYESMFREKGESEGEKDEETRDGKKTQIPKKEVETLRKTAEDFGAPPLNLLQLSNPKHVRLVHQLIKYSAIAVELFLDKIVFPKALQFADEKLSACAQELGNEVVVSRCLGFTGTSDNLVPSRLEVHHAHEDLIQMMRTLSDANVVSQRVLPKGWNVESILNFAGKNEFDALIDPAGAITGLSNEEVARTLLLMTSSGSSVCFETQSTHCGKSMDTKAKSSPLLSVMPSSEGQEGDGRQLTDENGQLYLLNKKDVVIFLSSITDKPYFLSRQNPYVPIPLAECSVPLNKRFVFFDQLHCTGVDIHTAVDAKAVLTIGKDMSFRDMAQAAWRLRGLGPNGQSLCMLISPEIKKAIHDRFGASSEKKEEKDKHRLPTNPSVENNTEGKDGNNEEKHKQEQKRENHFPSSGPLNDDDSVTMSDTLSWLALNSIPLISMNAQKLKQQEALTESRRNAVTLCHLVGRELVKGKYVSHQNTTVANVHSTVLGSFSLQFTESVDFSVPSTIPSRIAVEEGDCQRDGEGTGGELDAECVQQQHEHQQQQQQVTVQQITQSVGGEKHFHPVTRWNARKELIKIPTSSSEGGVKEEEKEIFWPLWSLKVVDESTMAKQPYNFPAEVMDTNILITKNFGLFFEKDNAVDRTTRKLRNMVVILSWMPPQQEKRGEGGGNDHARNNIFHAAVTLQEAQSLRIWMHCANIVSNPTTNVQATLRTLSGMLLARTTNTSGSQSQKVSRDTKVLTSSSSSSAATGQKGTATIIPVLSFSSTALFLQREQKYFLLIYRLFNCELSFTDEELKVLGEELFVMTHLDVDRHKKRDSENVQWCQGKIDAMMRLMLLLRRRSASTWKGAAVLWREEK